MSSAASITRRVATLCLIAVLCAAAGCATSARTAPPARQLFAHAAVVTDHAIASRAGLDMLQLGGNAIDAAVAASFCLSVVRPDSCGIGGGGFMLIHVPGKHGAGPTQIAINYRETAPARLGPDYYTTPESTAGPRGEAQRSPVLSGTAFRSAADRGTTAQPEHASRIGHHAVGVPGTVAGLLWALEEYGTLDRWTVLAPAIAAAEDGFPADAHHVEAAREMAAKLEQHAALREPARYLWEQLCLSGRVRAGDTITNPQQARALCLLALNGANAFYRGPIGNAIVRSMGEHGGPLTRDDLASYTISITTPLHGSFRGHEILAMPPPSSGGVAMLQALGIIERRLDGLSPLDREGATYIHLVAEALKHAFADRAAWLADPAFVEVPTRALLDPKYLDELASRVSMTHALQPSEYGSRATSPPPPPDDAGTSHLSVIDADGMAVACTETINLAFGSCVCVPGFGFALNNEMDDFTTNPSAANAFGLVQSARNLPAPGKRPLSSMSPTIVLKDGRAVMVAGASGGPRIISGTLQAILNCLLFDMPAWEAVAAPRFHHQWMPHVLELERRWRDDTVLDALRASDHEVARSDRASVVQLIRVVEEGIQAASDPRKGGAPAGR